MEITQRIREMADDLAGNGNATLPKDDVEAGLRLKSKEFAEKGAQLYVTVE
jgi:hypothetical protein